MKRIFFLSIIALSCASVFFALNGSGKLTGSYVEVRSVDVYAGACFANSEGGLVGKEGTMAWNIKGGEYQGIPLKGLSVVAVVKGAATLGDKYTAGPIRSVLIYDARATEIQRKALRGFVEQAAGKMLGTIVREETVPITFEQAYCEPVTGHEEHLGQTAACVKVKAGDIVTLQTRNILHTDMPCSLAELFYEPMTHGVRNETAAFASQMVFRGLGLDTTWNIPDKRGGFVADFELVSGQLTENQ